MIVSIIRPSRLGAVKDALNEGGFSGITVIAVKGRGSQKGIVERYRGSEYKIDLLDKIELKVVVEDDDTDNVIKIITDAAKTNE